MDSIKKATEAAKTPPPQTLHLYVSPKASDAAKTFAKFLVSQSAKPEKAAPAKNPAKSPAAK